MGINCMRYGKYDKGKEMILKGYLQPVRDKQQTKTAHAMIMSSA